MEILNEGGGSGRVVLCAPRWLAPLRKGETVGLPLEALATAAAVADAGFEVAFLDEAREPDLETALRRLDGPWLVGCVWMGEIYTYQLRGVARFVSALRRLSRETPIVVGGQLVTICPPDILNRFQGAALFVHGLGEDVLPEVCRRAARGETLAGLPGTAVTGATALRSIPSEPRRELGAAYGRFYRMVDLSPYVERRLNVFGNRDPMLKVRLGRGCSKSCDFCYHFRVHSSRVPADEAAETVTYLREKYDVRQFSFHELDFFSDRPRALAIADRLAARAPGVTWFALGSVSDLIRYRPEDIARLHAGGCRIVELGSESGSARVIDRIGKKHRPEDSVDVTRRLLHGRVDVIHNVIFGIPGETREDRGKTLALVRELLDAGPGRVLVHPRLYQLSPGTPLGDATRARYPTAGFPKTFEDVVEYRADFDRVRAFPWMGPDEEREVKALCAYFIPMLELRGDDVPRALRGVVALLRRLADARVRHGFFRLGIDRWAFERLLRARLTFVDAFAE